MRVIRIRIVRVESNIVRVREREQLEVRGVRLIRERRV